jgi:hypothetical protein
MGILERLENKMDTLIELLQSKQAAPLLGEERELVGKKAPLFIPPTADKKAWVSDPNPEKKADVEEGPVDLYAGVDKQDLTWDERINSKAAQPMNQTNGKWKVKRGLAEGYYDQIIAEKLAELESSNADIAGFQDATDDISSTYFWMDSVTRVAGIAEDQEEMDLLLAIPTTVRLSKADYDAFTQPVTKKAPAAPRKAPAAPNLSADPEKTTVLGYIKELTDFKCEQNDITELMVDTTGYDTISKVQPAEMLVFRDALGVWIDHLVEANKCIEAMQIIADANGFLNEFNEGLESIFEPQDVDCVGLIHFTEIEGVLGQLTAYLVTWQAL